MSAPTPAVPITVDNLLHKIGSLSVNNEFLSGELQRLTNFYERLHIDVHAEIAKIEAEADAEEKAVSDKIKAVVARVRAKL